MTTVALSTKAVGSIVKLKVGGTPQNFIVVHKGKPSDAYDAGCDGVWLLMEGIYEFKQWHSSKVNDYANSEIHAYLNSTFLGLFDANSQAQIKQVKIPYRPGSGYGKTVNSGANGLPTKIFLLSGTEVGMAHAYIPVLGAALDYFKGCAKTGADTKRTEKVNSSAASWFLRCPYCYADTGETQVQAVNSNGSWSKVNCTNNHGIRPALVLNSSLMVYDDGTVNMNTAPTTPASINIPSSVEGGTSIEVSWSAASDAENNLEGYELERSTDGGSSWTNIYKGNARSTTNTVPFGTESVMYRVRAYDSEGLYSGYKSSSQVTVINNSPPSVPASITVPNEVIGGGNLTITWGVSTDSDGNLSGYALERQVDGGAWTEIYRGNALNYTDTITRGWASVAYRVRAYDARTAYSGYATSPDRAVNNNTPPAITCASPTGSDLGTKTSGFTVGYSVKDDDGDTVTVAEKVDGAQKRSFTATPDAGNTFTVDDEDFMKLLNGPHALAITATDGKATTTHNLTFTKSVTSAFITLEAPMEADAPITICVLSVIGSIPADAEYTVEVSNNALDDEPVWEDCTMEVKGGSNHIFANKNAANGFAFNFRVNAERGPSGQGGYINSVQGGFQ